MNPGFASLGRALLPEATLLVAALVAFGIDLTALRRRPAAARLRTAALVAAAGVVVAGAFALLALPPSPVFGGVLVLDPLAVGARVGVLAFALIVLAAATAAPAPPAPAEYVALILFSAVGLLLLADARQLLLGFVALELASLPLYVLTGYDRSRAESAEAAIKYFLFGGAAAAFLLFGFSLIYGITGSLSLPLAAATLAHHGGSPMAAAALVMVLVAFGFKSAAAPFHFWAPDAYQGAPAASGALIASASKLAGWVFFARLLVPDLGDPAVGFASGLPAWAPAVAALAAASILIGNLAALAQGNVRRLLAYSAVSHAGALLLGVMAARVAGPGPLFYYALTYGLATAGAFGVIAVLESGGPCQRLEDLAGLWRRAPLLAACLFVFVLSLAGVPPLAGFFGKVFVFTAAFRAGGLPAWLAAAALAFSAVGFYYYLRILKQVLVAGPSQPAPPARPAGIAGWILAAAAALVLVLGLFPSLVLSAVP